jgi:ParB family transcriptional regulator, chromosome partitioning protein
MSKKRRMFDIDLPADDAPVAAGTEPQRRGPMATAISETADANRHRAAIEAEIRAENDALAHEFVRLKKLGLITDLVPLSAVRTRKLVRDRSSQQDPELADLIASIRDIGLSNPILVEPDGQGGYELVQGWRRLSAFQALHAETGDPRFEQIPASLMPAGQTLEGLYRRMVDENLVRKDISWAEMAQLARAYVADGVAGCGDLDHAVNLLYASANPQKRSYIRRFAFLLSHLEAHLQHPEALSRSMGLALAQRIEMVPGADAIVIRALQAAPLRSPAEEIAILQGVLQAAEETPVSPRGMAGRGRPASRGKTSLRLLRPEGELRCTAAPGKIELRLDRDFSAVERGRLEAAVSAFFAELDGRGRVGASG